jgi:hypothetical protein
LGSLIIPEEYELGFAKLIALDDSVMEQLLEALSEAPMVLRPTSLASKLTERLSGSIEGDDMEDIVQALVSLYYIGEDFEHKEQFAEEIVEAIEDSDSEILNLPKEDRDRFKQQLIKFLDIDSLRIASKAVFLLHEYERVFCDARVMTDIRPIFGSSPDEPPKAALIIHTLKLNYHDATGLKEFYVAMDSDEMDELMYVLDRADSKAKSLRAVLDAAKLSRVDADT